MILDTHTLLWLDRDDPALGSLARSQIETAWCAGLVAVSANRGVERATGQELPMTQCRK